jgi:hypothetical protein
MTRGRQTARLLQYWREFRGAVGPLPEKLEIVRDKKPPPSQHKMQGKNFEWISVVIKFGKLLVLLVEQI